MIRRSLLVAAIALYAISLALPAFELRDEQRTMAGWVWLAYGWYIMVVSTDPRWLAHPLFVFAAWRCTRRPGGDAIATASAALASLLAVACARGLQWSRELYVGYHHGDPRIGAYAWMAAQGVLLAATLVRRGDDA